MLTGSFLIMGETMRIDARLVDVGTGEVTMAEETTILQAAERGQPAAAIRGARRIPRQDVQRPFVSVSFLQWRDHRYVDGER